MKKYIGSLFVILITIGLIYILTGTSFEPVDRLMRPPKSEGRNSDIQTAFEASVTEKYILRSPLSGEHKSSFIFVDFNGDKSEEVVVFYSLSDVPDTVRMNILNKTGENWKSVADIESAHKQVHRVDFSDMDNDGIKEIITGWSIFDTELSNTLNIYKVIYNSNILNLKKIFESTYNEYILADMDSDGHSDMLILDNHRHNNKSDIKAAWYKFNGDKSILTGEIIVDPLISSVYSVCSDTDKETGYTRIYVDGYRNDSGMTTDLFYWDCKNNTFVRPFYSSSTSLASAATRGIALACRDVNNDSLIEIPFEEFIPESRIVTTSRTAAPQQNIVRWMTYSINGFNDVYFEIYNPHGDYSLKIKNDWYKKFSVINDTDKGEMTLFLLNPHDFSAFDNYNDKDYGKPEFEFDILNDDSVKNPALFSILVIAENESNFHNLTGYKYIKSNNGYEYYCRIFAAGKKAGITKDSIKKILYTGGESDENNIDSRR